MVYLFFALVGRRKFVHVCALAVVLPWLFFCFMAMEKCVFNGKWKADEKFKAWIAADPMSKTKAKCVVCNKAIDISIIGEAAGGWKMLLLLKGLWRCGQV